jgi:DNA polymerase-1
MGCIVPPALDRFAEVWCVDFEFISLPGERPAPICCVGRELRSGREVRLWDTEMSTPLPIAEDAVLVAYYAPAELGCYLALKWPLPEHVLDLFAEFRNFNNGRDTFRAVHGASLLAALAQFGLSHLDPETKAGWRSRILQGPPYSAADREGILDYCASDVTALEALLGPLAGRLESRTHWIDHALLRGRYMKAVAHMEHVGTPVDVEMLARLSMNWEELKVALIDDIRDDYPFFVGATLKLALFEQWLAQRGIPWPRTATMRLALSEDTFKSMARAYPEVAPIREVRDNLAKLRITDLTVGSDGRNRCMLSPLRARSGRNQPSASRFIFAPSAWLRSLIRPEPGMALAYIDFSSQEIGIAAALSGDAAMQRAYTSGDPYLSFAVDAELAPPGATKITHKALRDRCKVIVLGTLYGMQERTLAVNLNIQTAEARALLKAHRRAYATFWEWTQRVTDTAMLRGYLDTTFGWRLHVTADTRPTSLLNHPMQAHGAEMLRLACCYLTESGIRVCAPIHDAVLIEAPEAEMEEAIARTRLLMARASRHVLAGFEIRTDAEVIRHPDRYNDPRGTETWGRVVQLLERLEAAYGQSQSGSAPSQLSDGIARTPPQTGIPVPIPSSLYSLNSVYR